MRVSSLTASIFSSLVSWLRRIVVYGHPTLRRVAAPVTEFDDRLRALVERYEPESFSEHLAWSTHGDVYFNDLLPLPYTPETARRVADHVGEAQDALGMRLLLENQDFGQAALEYERTAYAYPDHERSAEAGYAAILAYREHEKSLAGAARADWHQRYLDSGLKFADCHGWRRPEIGRRRRGTGARHPRPPVRARDG